jgi:hypothetical protein
MRSIVRLAIIGFGLGLATTGAAQQHGEARPVRGLVLEPEVVERVEVRKGPYDARDGNLVTAGAVDFQTRDRVDGGSVELRGGSFGTAPATAIVSVEPVTGGVRYRHVGARPADENGSVEARGHDVEWNEAQFATTSRLQDEASPGPEPRFTPGPGRALQLAVEYRF